VMEVFVNDGRSVATPIIYPNEGDLGLAVFARGGTARLRSLSAWKMKSIWSSPE
jgi:sucrose-6-phosphate hydrolase SacC (GH32 family)